jgi:hypothetical protein
VNNFSSLAKIKQKITRRGNLSASIDAKSSIHLFLSRNSQLDMLAFGCCWDGRSQKFCAFVSAFSHAYQLKSCSLVKHYVIFIAL